ncbi:MAG TPA: S1 RNA-binding domain-containing protein [Lacipirellula sp.]
MSPRDVTSPAVSPTPPPIDAGEQAIGSPAGEATSADSAQTSSAESAPAAAEPTLSGPPHDGGPATERPSARIQIGSQRDAGDQKVEAPKPKPVTPGPANPDRPPAEQKRKSYPPPNIRAQLPPELEQELQAALAEGSVDELMASTTDATATAELAPETRVKGRVVSLHEEDVFFDLGGGRNQGVAPLKQFETPPEVGAEIDMMVVRFDAEQGIYEISRPAAAVAVGNWDEVHDGQVVEVTITGSNKGGLECQVSGIRGFIPMGQISVFRVENPEEYVGQRLACVITEANRSRKNLILSHRALMERERKENKEKMLAELAPGQIREGVVRSLQDFGAFVDLGGVDGLIHVSQMSWERISHPSEVLQVGQKVKVKVEKVNQETGKIGLSYQDRGDNPWEHVATKYAPGARVKGTVSKLAPFGAFVKLEPAVEGLIHISELGHGRVFRTSDVLSEGQEVEAKILTVDVNAQRISLSLKALLPPPEKPEKKAPEPEARREPTPEELKRQERRRKEASELKGGISTPTGGEKFGLKW